MGGDEALHELLHATGHRTRLAWLTTGVYSPRGYAEEEGTVLFAKRLLPREVGQAITATVR